MEPPGAAREGFLRVRFCTREGGSQRTGEGCGGAGGPPASPWVRPGCSACRAAITQPPRPVRVERAAGVGNCPWLSTGPKRVLGEVFRSQAPAHLTAWPTEPNSSLQCGCWTSAWGGGLTEHWQTLLDYIPGPEASGSPCPASGGAVSWPLQARRTSPASTSAGLLYRPRRPASLGLWPGRCSG